MMYKSSSDSYNIVKNIILNSTPFDITIKKHREENILIVINSEYTLVFLNELASKFLCLCNGKSNIENIINTLFSVYDVEYEKITEDIIALVRDLQDRRIIYLEP